MPTPPSLYRRHRPRTFDEVVGQEAVVRTLRNAVEQGKVHHAYLFVGSRGTGKTSMAKILAACLNCERGPTVEPCRQCESCLAIANATSLDVIEMDAASNNSVDDVRELRERVAYAPVSGRHKVYILDEAHMLSTQAWNAFLKTLEEPPPNTVFVLATTDPQKVLATVVDRCHRFDFARPSAEQIASVLQRAAEAESIALPEAVSALVARRAGGSFRDALGDLEQIVTYSDVARGGTIDIDAVLAVLDLPDAELLFAALDAIAASDPAATLRSVEAMAQGGRDPGQFFRDLEEHARALMVVQTLGDVPAPLRVTPDQDARLRAQASTVGRAAVVALLDALARGLEAVKAGCDARTQLELALTRAAAPDLDASTQALAARVERLEAALATGGDAPPAPVSTTTSAPKTPGAPSPPSGSPAPPSAESTPTPAPAPAPGAEAPQACATVTAHGDTKALDLDAIRSLWPAVIETLRGDNAMLAALLEGARPVSLGSDELRLAFSESAGFLKRKAEGPANREAVSRALTTVAGRPLRLAYELRAEESNADGPQGSIDPDELVARLVAEFDAEEV